MIKVDCAEFQHSHEIAKLIGSPPGYLGHRETHPLITQEALASSHTEKLKLSFLLFDEIEKAVDALWQLLLGMLDKATLTLGDNRRVDLSQTVIFLTSNLGGGEITELMHGGMGFVQPSGQAGTGPGRKGGADRRGSGAAKVFSGIHEPAGQGGGLPPVEAASNWKQVLDIELGQVQQRVLDTAKGQVPVPRDNCWTRFPAAGRNRSALWRAAPEARHRAVRRLSAGESAGHGASHVWATWSASIGTASTRS